MAPRNTVSAVGVQRMTSLQHLTLPDLMARAHDDGAGCLVWDGYALHGTAPQWRIDYQLWPVRRLLWELVHGPIRTKHQIGLSCTEPLCVHPDHLVSRTRSSIQKGRKAFDRDDHPHCSGQARWIAAGHGDGA